MNKEFKGMVRYGTDFNIIIGTLRSSELAKLELIDGNKKNIRRQR